MTLKRLRILQKVKQKDMLKTLNVSSGCLSQWESGKRQPSIEIIPQLAKILNCSIEELVLAIIETKRGCKNGKVHS
mgnify:CR=1 FL=1